MDPTPQGSLLAALGFTLPEDDDAITPGMGVTPSVASGRWKVPKSTICKWAADKLVTVIEPAPAHGYPMVLDAWSVLQAVRLRRTAPGRGRDPFGRSPRRREMAGAGAH